MAVEHEIPEDVTDARQARLDPELHKVNVAFLDGEMTYDDWQQASEIRRQEISMRADMRGEARRGDSLQELERADEADLEMGS